ncbi:MAG: hypothetical protein ACJ8NS_04765 [Chthoniobacterales bacterium]|jgi:hypothetical protein
MSHSDEDIHVAVRASYSRGVPEGADQPSDVLTDFAFHRGTSHRVDAAHLALRGLPPLTFSIAFDGARGSFSVSVVHSGHNILELGNFIPASNSYLGARVSDSVFLHVVFLQPCATA